MFSTNRFASSPLNAFSKRLILAVVVLMIGAVVSSRCQAQPAPTAAALVVPLAENPLGAEFAACDADQDGSLTEAEYLKRAGRERPVLLREFRMFDLEWRSSDEPDRLRDRPYWTVRGEKAAVHHLGLRMRSPPA